MSQGRSVRPLPEDQHHRLDAGPELLAQALTLAVQDGPEGFLEDALEAQVDHDGLPRPRLHLERRFTQAAF